MKRERVVENLNHALRRLLETDDKVVILGEDIADPYGGAFKVTKGLSTLFPDRVRATPISENATVGIAGGLALAGYKPIVELMFGDFVTLAYDQIVNFATKSVAMYGRRVEMNVLVRCPVGGNRGYGPTHSQCVQKHFLGVPHLSLFELNAFVDAADLLPRLLGLGHPCILFEDKGLYGTHRHGGGKVDEVYRYEPVDPHGNVVRAFPAGSDRADCLVLTSGGPFARCLEAAERLLIDDELETHLLVLTQLHPARLDLLAPFVRSARRVVVVDEAGGPASWGSFLAGEVTRRFWGALDAPVEVIQSKDGIIPAAHHLERRVLVQADDIYRSVKGGPGHA